MAVKRIIISTRNDIRMKGNRYSSKLYRVILCVQQVNLSMIFGMCTSGNGDLPTPF